MVTDEEITKKLNKLKEVLPFKWKVQTAGKFSAQVVAYIDARSLQDKLDEVVGPQNWKVDFKEVGQYFMGGISIRIYDEWVCKWDVGMPSQFDAEKGQVSDAFKRAGVQWGVARFLYEKEIANLSVMEKDTSKGKKNVPCHDQRVVNFPVAKIPRGIMAKKQLDNKWVDSLEIKNVNRYMNEVYIPVKEGKLK